MNAGVKRWQEVEMHPDTVAVHAGAWHDATTGAVAPPIYLSTTFERTPELALTGEFSYSRMNNPNRSMLEEALRALEGGAACAAFASGSAATATVFQALRPGDHVIAPVDAYYGTSSQLREIFAPWGLETTFVDMTSLDAVRAAFRPETRLIWAESPSNPQLRLVDIEPLVELAHARGAAVAVDNTWATPVHQRPLALGADLVMHSATKYLGGNDDVLGGALVAREETPLFSRIRSIQGLSGGVPSPFECWLVLRNLRMLPARMALHSASALRVATFLESHPAVARVHYPGLPSHPQHDIARRQMRGGFGGMLAFEVNGGWAAAAQVKKRLRLITRATSLGGPSSLIEHRAMVEGPGTTTPESLLRLSVGLEHADDLIADLAQALDAGDADPAP